MGELTPEEKQKIYEEEKFRLEAQKNLIKSAQKKKSQHTTIGCLVAIILIVFVVLYVSIIDRAPSSSSPVPQAPKEITDTATKMKVEAIVKEALGNGTIKKISIQASKAWIQEDVWTAIDSQIKENIAKNLALYFSIQKNQEYRSAEIIGWISGKKMASYTSLGGFKVY